MVDVERYKKMVKKHRRKIASLKNYDEWFSKLDTEKVGSLTTTSGRIVLCPLDDTEDEDGFIEYYYKAEAGTYPVELAKAPSGRNAAVRIVFSEQPAVRYELALIGNEDEMDCISSLEAGRIPLYESCTTSPLFIIDQGLIPDFLEELRKNYPSSLRDQEYYEKCAKKLLLESSTCDEEPECSGFIDYYLKEDDAHIPIFVNGAGGGHHPIYWGFDSSEKICQLVFDFNLKELRDGSEDVKPGKWERYLMKLRHEGK